jgi:hypothetical protein
MRHAYRAFLVVAAALGARAESTTSTPFDGSEAPLARASRHLFLGADSPPPPKLSTDACVVVSKDDGNDCDDDDGSEFPTSKYCTDCVDCCPRVPRAPPAGTPSGTGSLDAKYPIGQLGIDCADYGPGQPPAASPAPLRSGTGICMKNSVESAHVLDGGSILNPRQLVCWGCLLMASLMAWHRRFAKSPCSRPHRPREKQSVRGALTFVAQCTMLPCTETSDVPVLNRGLQLAVPIHRRELQNTNTVFNPADLTSALANTAVSRIVLASGTYNLIAELSITRSVILEAVVAGSVILNAQASSSSERRVLNINPGSSGVVQLIGLNITGGYYSGSVRAHVHNFPSP